VLSALARARCLLPGAGGGRGDRRRPEDHRVLPGHPGVEPAGGGQDLPRSCLLLSRLANRLRGSRCRARPRTRFCSARFPCRTRCLTGHMTCRARTCSTRERTHQSLLPYLLEEAYEAEAIETGDLAALREEIGDVMFQAFFHARIAAERSVSEDGFTIDDVADTLAAKLARRHPQVFADVTVSSAADVNANWEEIKKAERAARRRLGGAVSSDDAGVPSVLDGVSFGQPALSLAAQLQRLARRAGLAVDTTVSDGGSSVGDALMAMVASAREAGLDPELELGAAAWRFADSVRDRERTGGAAGE